jgi:acyl carrier protein
MSIAAQVIEIISDNNMMDPDDIRMDHALETLGIDSMSLVEVIFTIEETFDVSVPFNANSPEDSTFDVSSVGQIIKAVEALIKDQG